MISAIREPKLTEVYLCFSAIARSVMISAGTRLEGFTPQQGFSAIARSVMISAQTHVAGVLPEGLFQCYSS